MSNNAKKELIIWIDSGYKLSGENNEFSYNIGSVPFNDKSINVELIKAYVTYNFDEETGLYLKRIPFYALMIKIYVDFGVGSNQRNNANGLLMGVIITNSFPLTYLQDETFVGYVSPEKSGEEFIGDPIMYTLHEKPNQTVNVKIYNASDVALSDDSVDADPPRRVLLCLKFSY